MNNTAKLMLRAVCLVVAVLCLGGLVGCVVRETPPQPTATDTEQTTQQTRDLIPTGAMAQMILLTLAPERLAALATSLTEAELAFLPPEIARLPVLGTINGDMGTAQLEEVMLCRPQYIVDVGTTRDDTLAQMAQLEQTTGIATIHISASIATMGESYIQLGQAIGEVERAKILARYCTETYEAVVAQVATIATDTRCKTVYTQGDTGLYVLSQGSSHAEIIDLWCDNVAVLELPTVKGLGDEVDMEQMLLWNPDVIFFGPNSIYDTVGDDPHWSHISAIQTGQYYQIPAVPYNWLGMPASINTYLGLQWVGEVLYPQANHDFYPTAAEFMDLFYGYTLTQAEFDSLCKTKTE